MKLIEITPRDIGMYDDIAESMARSYQIAFSGKPWFEASRCINEVCSKGFCEYAAGSSCPSCTEMLVEAYDTNDLTIDWRNMLLNEDAFMEVALNQNNEVVSTTIARPTSREELILRKYTDDESMMEWVDDNLPRNFTWIEDTFANRNLQTSGNLAQRGRTLARIALRYCGNDIATRTIEPRVIGATARDVGQYTDMYRGTNSLELRNDNVEQMRSIGSVPDWRTVLMVDGKGLTA